MISVTINNDNGKFSVGMEPQGEGTETNEGSGMDMMKGQPEYQPAKDIEEALMIARRLLTQDQGQSPFDEGLKDTMQSKGRMIPGMM